MISLRVKRGAFLVRVRCVCLMVDGSWRFDGLFLCWLSDFGVAQITLSFSLCSHFSPLVLSSSHVSASSSSSSSSFLSPFRWCHRLRSQSHVCTFWIAEPQHGNTRRKEETQKRGSSLQTWRCRCRVAQSVPSARHRHRHRQTHRHEHEHLHTATTHAHALMNKSIDCLLPSASPSAGIHAVPSTH